MKRCILIALSCFAGMAYAGPITYTQQATATGSLGALNFTDAVVTMTMVGDTSHVVDHTGYLTNSVGLFTVNVSGQTAAFTDQLWVVDNQTSSLVGFGDISNSLWVLGTVDAAFATYDLRSAIGPVVGMPNINISGGFATTAGSLVFDSYSGNATFTATTDAVPEPVTGTLLGFGLVAILGYRRRRIVR